MTFTKKWSWGLYKSYTPVYDAGENCLTVVCINNPSTSLFPFRVYMLGNTSLGNIFKHLSKSHPKDDACCGGGHGLATLEALVMGFKCCHQLANQS